MGSYQPPEYYRRKRAERVARGGCYQCATRAALPGRKRCGPCGKSNARNQRLRQRDCLVAGVCFFCSKPKGADSAHRTRCAKCAQRQAELDARRKQARTG